MKIHGRLSRDCGAVLLVLAAALTMAADRPTATLVAPNPFEGEARPVAQCEIDRLVFARLRELAIEPSHLCSDAVFVRRVYLDVIGLVPTAKEAEAFLAGSEPNKRSVLINRLLEREEFADYWAMKWCDVLRVKGEFPINLWPKAAQAYHQWIRTSIRQNQPYDKFVRDLLLSGGSNFYCPPANFYRAVQNRQPQGLAQAVALTFMGERTEKWPKDRLAGLSAFFEPIRYKATGEWKEEIVYLDPSSLVTGAVFPDGTTAAIAPGQDPREVLAGWLTSPRNPWFARNAVNRLWYWLLGRGIVHEPDDFRPDNPPANPLLLAYLERELLSARYDLKHVLRLILNSRTYQLSSIRRGNDPRAEANFASYPLRQLDAEVLADVLCQVTGTSEKYSSPVPEPFTYVPQDEGTVETANGNTASPFLELFGRSSRDTGRACERNCAPSAGQRLHLLNSSHVQQKIEQGRVLQSLAALKGKPQEAANTVYLTVLSRLPTDQERKTLAAYGSSSGLGGREVVVDLFWALINSDEFLYRH
jgi:hypothetical protein